MAEKSPNELRPDVFGPAPGAAALELKHPLPRCSGPAHTPGGAKSGDPPRVVGPASPVGPFFCQPLADATNVMPGFRGVLLGLSGRARVGKDTAAAILRELHGFETMAFADPIKDAARVWCQHWDDLFLSSPSTGKDRPDVTLPAPVSPREVFQVLGAAMRRVHQDWWLWQADRILADLRGFGHRHVVVTDVRYANEARWVRRHGGKVVHLTRRDAAPVRAHVSEAGVPVKPGDLSIANDGSVSDLRRKLAEMMYHLG